MNLFEYKYEEYSEQYDFFYKNKYLFKPTINGEHHTNKHKYNYEIIKNKYNITFPYGKCFPISQFIFYYLGGYNSKYVLKCIRKIPIKIDNYQFTTSHWFVHEPNENIIIDLTKKQFDKLLNIEDYYELGRRANYGYKYFHKNKNKIYSHTVPCSQVLKLYKHYREKHEKNEHLEYWLKEYISP